MNIEQLKRQMSEFETFSDYEVFLTQKFNEMIDKGNFELCHEIANFILFGKIKYFSGKARMDFLVWKLDRLSEKLHENYSDEVEKELEKLIRFSPNVIRNIPTSLHVEKGAFEEAIDLLSLYYAEEEQQRYISRIRLTHALFLGDVQGISAYYDDFKKYKTDSVEDLVLEVRYLDFIHDYESLIQLENKILSFDDNLIYWAYPALIRAYIYRNKLKTAQECFSQTLKLVENDNHLYLILEYMEVAAILNNYKKLHYLNETYKDEIINQCDLYYCMKYFIISSCIIPHHYMIAQNIVADFDRRNGNSYYKNYLALFYENFKEKI